MRIREPDRGPCHGPQLLTPFCLLALNAPILKMGQETPDEHFFEEDVSIGRNVDAEFRGNPQFWNDVPFA